ncbi:DNA-binding transcriptional MerR regulator [Mucilaginibacter rubeus]|uniref:MerR family transcriptional regulator n=1 Tax=Mucilaginibacter rubeus TaxID=2027860 RepID=UPI0033980E08
MSYSISDLEQLSGVSAHNIRIWERRYQAFTPSRTAGNTRFYNDDQLKKLLNIAGLYHAGYKISKACALSREEMNKLLQTEIDKTRPARHKHEYFISQIISNALIFHEYAVNELITKSFEQNGVLGTYKFVIYPMLVRAGLMWLNNSLCPSQEHFLSSIIRQKLFSAINDCMEQQQNSKPLWLLFLPEDEDHDIGLLLASYMLRTAGYRVIYLGPQVPMSALNHALESTQPHNLLFFMTRVRPIANAQAYIDQLASTFKSVKIYLSGNKQVINSVHFPKNVYWLETLPDFEQIIAPVI